MKYFLFNHTTCENRGCEAILNGTKNILRNADKNAEFVLSTCDADYDSKAVSFAKVTSASKRELSKSEHLLAGLNVKLLHSERYSVKTMLSDVIDSADECDICLSVGGDTYCYGDNYEQIVISEELLARGKKVFLWGASIGEEDLTAEKEENLKKFSGIFVREPLTYELLKGKNINKNLYMYADPAFAMEREDLPLPDGFEKDNMLGFNLSPLVLNKNPLLLNASIEFLNYIIDNTTLNIALIPHVTQKDNDDCTVLEKIHSKLKDQSRVVMLSSALSAKQYKGYIARLRFFIGARTHATIAAYSNGVPTVVLGYSVKSRGISKDLFGNEKYVLNYSDIKSGETIINKFEQLLEEETEIKSTLREVIPYKVKSAMDAGEELLKNIC